MTKHRKIRLYSILWVVSHSSSPFKNHAWRLSFFKIYLHYWLSFINGAFIASSGTWKAVKVDRRPLNQTALSTIHLMLIAASLPTPMQGQGYPCRPLATHALFGISINECTLGSSGLTRWVCRGSPVSVAVQGRVDARPTALRPPNLLTIGGKGHLHHHLWK